MIVPDVNLLVYAYKEGAPEHEAARQWWETLLNGPEDIGIPWVVAVGFIRVMVNPRAMGIPILPSQSITTVREWFGYDHIRPLNPGTRHLQFLQQTLAATGDTASAAMANRVPDAHIAALALEYDAEVHTNDDGFDRFPGLLWRNPLR